MRRKVSSILLIFCCHLIFDQPQDFVVDGFTARLAEMNGHAVVGRTDSFREYA